MSQQSAPMSLLQQLQQLTDLEAVADPSPSLLTSQVFVVQSKPNDLPSYLIDAQQALAASQHHALQLSAERASIQQAFASVKHDYAAQSQRIHAVELQITELERLKELVETSKTLKTDRSPQTLQAGLQLHQILQKTFNTQLKPASEIQQAIAKLSQVSFSQQLVDDIYEAAKELLIQNLQQFFAFEQLYVSELQNNLFGKTMTIEKPVIYDIVTYYFQKIFEILPKRLSAELHDAVFDILKEPVLDALAFSFIQDSFYIVNDLFHMFGQRSMKLIKQQFDIQFQLSPLYNKEKQIGVVQASKMYFKVLAQYLQQLFEQLQLDSLFFGNKVQLRPNLTVKEFRESNSSDVGLLSKTLSASIKLLYKRPKAFLVGELLTTCKDPDIKTCFARNYFRETEVFSRDMMQQVIIDQIVQIVFKYFDGIEQIMCWTGREIDDKIYSEIIVGLEGSTAKELLGQIVQLVLQKIVSLDQIE